jgi:hypothetical protein
MQLALGRRDESAFQAAAAELRDNMDRYTHDRLQDEAILREQDRASLRTPTHTKIGPLSHGVRNTAVRPAGPNPWTNNALDQVASRS